MGKSKTEIQESVQKIIQEVSEDILNTEQAKFLKTILDDAVDDKLIALQTLYSTYAQDGICDCDLHSATLSDITRLVEQLDRGD